ncbi:hypothetical protein MRB53_033883 [Persea americana]|uniref:Uncharacterized protein n=1 Tax=Persea americana TaxID=3435 RepID=A0ACC2KW73_PERAE|nr:hypothetical protein MRB53_033883 [Persea americana]
MGEGPCIHVLVVDDCPIDRKVVEKLLLKTGTFAVTIAGGGEKALEILGLDEENAEFANVNDCKIDLILTDYCMPGINGYDLLKAIKDHTSLKAIPVVIMSSENNPERISRCRMTGAEDFVLKPLHLRDIQRLRSYVKPRTPRTKTGTKRKVPLDMMPESNRSERQTRPAGVVVA